MVTDETRKSSDSTATTWVLTREDILELVRAVANELRPALSETLPGKYHSFVIIIVNAGREWQALSKNLV